MLPPVRVEHDELLTIGRFSQLTGLTAKQLMRLGGVRIYAPEEERIVWEWLPAAATPR